MNVVAVILLVLGLWFLASALFNWDWFYGIIDFAVLETLLGESAARWACGIFGVVLVGSGCLSLMSR